MDIDVDALAMQRKGERARCGAPAGPPASRGAAEAAAARRVRDRLACEHGCALRRCAKAPRGHVAELRNVIDSITTYTLYVDEDVVMAPRARVGAAARGGRGGGEFANSDEACS